MPAVTITISVQPEAGGAEVSVEGASPGAVEAAGVEAPAPTLGAGPEEVAEFATEATEGPAPFALEALGLGDEVEAAGEAAAPPPEDLDVVNAEAAEEAPEPMPVEALEQPGAQPAGKKTARKATGKKS